MSDIELKYSLRKGDFRLDVDASIPGTGVTGLFGDSGSGKTTLLRCIAGLERLQNGDQRTVHQRRIGYVFQDAQLFEHLSVRQNLQYGHSRNPASQVSLEEVADRLDIAPLLARRPTDLSGGEAQRVAIARVLCQSPKLILMDEPLSALDERRRDDLLPYLDWLHTETATPIIYVSHNIDEICRLADHLLLLNDGKIVAEGSVHEVLLRTDLPQLAGRNTGAVVDVTKLRFDREFGLTLFAFSGGEIWVTGEQSVDRTRLRIRASDISICRSRAADTTILNILPVTIDTIRSETVATVLIQLRCGDESLLARITKRSLQQMNLQCGDQVYAQIKSVTVRR